MKQYNVIYMDWSTEIVEAYDYKYTSRDCVVFDFGAHRTRKIANVREVEELGEAE